MWGGRRIRLLFFAILLGLSQAACATMFSGSSQKVLVKVYPEDAITKVDGAPTPAGEIELKREKAHVLEIEKEGFKGRRIAMSQDLNGWFFANLLWGPFFWVGMLVDAMTGSMQELTPSNVTVSLDPSGPPGSVPPPPPPSGGANVSRSGGSSSSGFSVTFVTPFDPTVTSRGTGMDKKSAPPPPPPPSTTVTPAGPSVAPETTKPAGPTPGSPPPSPPSERKRPARSRANASQQTWVLAVMDVETSGKKNFEKDTLLALTDQIRVFLAERSLRVIDRSSMDAAMKSIVQEEKARSYKSCVDQSCQIPLGKALAASHIMRATVARFGSQCATNGELIDLRSEVTVAAGSARSGCEEEDLLYAAESLAEQLVTASAQSQ